MLWKALLDSMSYLSANPKSTSTGTVSSDMRILAGL